MAIKNVLRPFTVTNTTGSTASFTEETGKTAENKIISIRTLSDDGAGHFAGGRGTVNYVGKQLQARLVDLNRSTESYKSDYENAKEFEKTVGDGEGSSSTDNAKGGEYSTASVSEEVLAAVQVRYSTGAGVPRAKNMKFTPPAVVLDLLPYTTDPAVPNSVQFDWMGTTYIDVDGLIYRGRSGVSAGFIAGQMDYEGGVALMNDYVVPAGAHSPTDFQLRSLFIRKQQWTSASLFFNTDTAPVRPGPGGFVLDVVDTKGDTLIAQIDGQGNITGNHMRGRIEPAVGAVNLQFGDFVDPIDLTPEQLVEWWFAPADIGAVEPGKIWRPWPVLPETLSYTMVGQIYLPVDVNLMGLDPAALPADGRVVGVRAGNYANVGEVFPGDYFTPTVGMTYNVGHTRLSWVQVLGPDGTRIFTGFDHDLDAGTVTFTDLTDYPAQVKVEASVGVYKQVAEAYVDGRVRLTQPVGYAFPAGAIFSTALRHGDRFARVASVWDQYTWDGIDWPDGLVGNPAPASFDTTNFPITVNNLGAITDTYALKIRLDGISFDCYTIHRGLIAQGSMNADFAPLHPGTGVPCLHVPSGGWGAGWIPGNTLFIKVIGAERDIVFLQCIQPGTPVGLDDSFGFATLGGTDRAPGTSFP